MKVKELRDKSNEELAHELRELSAEVFNLRSRRITGQLDKPHRFKEIRKTVARIKTILNERELKPSNDTQPTPPLRAKAGQASKE